MYKGPHTHIKHVKIYIMSFNLYICIYCSPSQTLCHKTDLHKVATFSWVDLTGLQEKSQQVVKVQGLTTHVMATWLMVHICFKTCGMFYHQMMVYVQEPLVGVVYTIYCINQNKFGWYNKLNTLTFRIVSMIMYISLPVMRRAQLKP